jgi:hypothetical protein
MELDMCLLQGKFKVMTGDSEKAEIVVDFNTANYYKEFEGFVRSVRKYKLAYDKNGR